MFDLITVDSLLDSLRAHFGNDASAARAIGLTRQQMHLARLRRRLSDDATIRAATALDIDPGFALACIQADISTSPIVAETWLNIAARIYSNSITPPLYYVKSEAVKNEKKAQNRIADDERLGRQHAVKKSSSLHHVPLSPERENALRVLKWCLCVARIPPDSPRLAYYVSRWNVPFKIDRALADGSFETATANCPPIDLCHLPAALAAIAESDTYNKTPPPIIATTRPARLHA